MQKWVALLRGINVGGANKVPMAELRALCADLGWQDVRTYIASGNVVFSTDGVADDLAKKLQQAIAEKIGVTVPVLMLSEKQVRDALHQCPFPRDVGKAVHGFFCFNDPTFYQDVYEAYRIASEDVQIIDRTVWLYAPDGIGRSKLVEKFGKVITGTDVTARNLNTITKLVEMLDG